MAQWVLLERLDIPINENKSVSFMASNGHRIQLNWVSEDIDFVNASGEKRKLKRGWRCEIEISFIEYNSVYYSDFLREIANMEEVEITYSSPLDLGGKHLVLKDFEIPEVYHDSLFFVRAKGWIKERFDNIPNL